MAVSSKISRPDAASKAPRGQGVAGFLVMMGQQCGGFVQTPCVRLFQRDGRRGMRSPAPLPKLRVQGARKAAIPA